MATLIYNQIMIMKIIFFILLSLTLYDTTDSCSCAPSHPQSQYCSADYVILARITLKSTLPNELKDTYKIKIKKAYKMSEKAREYLKSRKLITSSLDSMCGVKLDVGKLYIIAGNSKTIGLCNYVKNYENVTFVERNGFASHYQRGCSCKIRPCFKKNCNLELNTCNWSPFSACQTDFSICKPLRQWETSEGVQRKCRWIKTTEYKKCLSNEK